MKAWVDGVNLCTDRQVSATYKRQRGPVAKPRISSSAYQTVQSVRSEAEPGRSACLPQPSAGQQHASGLRYQPVRNAGAQPRPLTSIRSHASGVQGCPYPRRLFGSMPAGSKQWLSRSACSQQHAGTACYMRKVLYPHVFTDSHALHIQPRSSPPAFLPR